jgi:hypothetical protein
MTRDGSCLSVRGWACEILVSQTVRDLVVGADITVEDRGPIRRDLEAPTITPTLPAAASPDVKV